MYHGTIINILNNLIKTIIKINDKFYQFKIITRLFKINKYY